MITKAELDRLHRAVPKDYYHRGIQRNIFQRIWHHGRFRLITNELHRLRLSGAVLDIGCHSGDLTNVIAAAADTPTYGVDLSAQSINYARERFPAINFQCVDFAAGLPSVSDDPGPRAKAIAPDHAPVLATFDLA